MATAESNRRYQELLANAPNKAAIQQPKNYSYTGPVPTGVQYGQMTRSGAGVSKAPAGERYKQLVENILPVTPEGQKNWKSAGNYIVSSIRNANNAGQMLYDLSPLNIYQKLVNPNYVYGKMQDLKNFKETYNRNSATIESANNSYENGSITKSERDQIVNDTNKTTIRSTVNVASREIPLTGQELVDTIDGLITLSTLGTYTAAKAGAFKGAELGLNQIRKMVMSRMANAEAISALRGANVATKANILKSALPSTTEKLGMLADDAIDSIPILKSNYNSIIKKIGTSETSRGYAKNVLIETAFWAPMRRENIRFAQDMLDNIRNDNWFADENKMGAVPQSVLLAGMVLEGGPVGFIAKNFGKAGKALKMAMYDEDHVIDVVSQNLSKMKLGVNVKNPSTNLIDGIAKAIPKLSKDIQDNIKPLLKQFTGTALKKGPANKVGMAIAEDIVRTIEAAGKNVEDVDYEWVATQMIKNAYANSLLESYRATGLAASAAKYSIDIQDNLVKKIANAIKAAKDDIAKLSTREEKLAAKKALAKEVIAQEANAGHAWTQHEDVMKSILGAIDSANKTEFIVNAPKVFSAGKQIKKLPKDLAKKFDELGYVPVISENKGFVGQISKAEAEGVALKSKYVAVDDALFQQAAVAKPFFREAGAALRWAGLGLDDSAAVAYKMTRDNARMNIDEALGRTDGAKILNAMQQWTEVGPGNRFADLVPGNMGNIRRRTTTDIRQMTNRQIKEALLEAGMTDAARMSNREFSIIRQSIINAHVSVPRQVMGLADSLIAGAYKYTGGLYGKYAKIQGALRYTYNPFFTVQEKVETKLLGQAMVPGLTNKTKAELDSTIKRLDELGFFNSSTLVGTDLSKSLMATRFGEGAQDVYLGRVTAQLTLGQKRDLAAVVERVAKKMNLTVEDALKLHGAEIEDLVRPIVQYPTSGALASNAAKMLNLAMFPSRYNIKVTALAVKALAQAPPSVQLLTVNKLWEFENWMRTPEGIAWQQEHNAAIQFFKWITPVGSIQWVFDTLATPFGKGHQSLANFGVIGGLPFGVIGQILESQGLYQSNTPYVNPETGDIYARKIPESMKARVASALMDLLGSTFTYPGATIGLTKLGLPSKSGMLRDAAQLLTLDTTSQEWSKIEYSNADLPNYDKLRQQIWSENYKAAEEDQPAPEPMKNRTYKNPKPLEIGKILTKEQLQTLKVQQREQKKAAKSAAKKKSKTTSFPSYLPQ